MSRLPRGQRSHRLALVLMTLLLGGTACQRLLILFPEEGQPGADAGEYEVEPWGRFIAGLDLPACASGATVHLVTAGGMRGLEDAGADPGLYLEDALALADASAGPDTILFDPQVFLVDTPLTIFLQPGIRFDLRNTCIDGRGAGVIIDWLSGTGYGEAPTIDQESLMVGLTLLHVSYEIEVWGRIAGCRLNTDGYQTMMTPRPWTVETPNGGYIGPGNVIAGLRSGMRQYGGTVRGNWFGYDPVTRQVLSMQQGIDVRTAGIIEDNVFAATSKNIAPWSLGTGQVPGELIVRRNFFGVDRRGVQLPGEGVGLHLARAAGLVEENIIRHSAVGIHLVGSLIQIKRNRISDNQSGITGAVLATPSLDNLDAGTLHGSCPVDGLVEIFWSSDGQGEVFLGEVACTVAGGFTFALPSDIPESGYLTGILTATDAESSRLVSSAFSPALPLP